MLDITQYKKSLETERATLTAELSKLGIHDPSNPENWDLKKPDIEIMQADRNEAADGAEEAHIESIVLEALEARYRVILHAQEKLDTDTYGMCEVCGEPVEEMRLAANAAARTCKKHLAHEDTLRL